LGWEGGVIWSYNNKLVLFTIQDKKKDQIAALKSLQNDLALGLHGKAKLK
jgi:hypothetical protein